MAKKKAAAKAPETPAEDKQPELFDEQTESNGKRTTFDWSETPLGLFIGKSARAAASFKTMEEAKAYVQNEVPLAKHDRCFIFQVRPVKVEIVETRITLG